MNGRRPGAPRREAFATGEARFTDDHCVPGALHAAFVRSSHAHAHLVAIDGAAARGMPGVVAVITAADIAGELRPLACYCRATSTDGRENAPAGWAILAADRVRYVGDPVACVVAGSAVEAEAAARTVAATYHPLPSFTDPFGAVRMPIWPGTPDNICFDRASGDAAETERLFRTAAHVTQLQLLYPRLAATPLETRAANATFDGSRFHLRTTCQGVHFVRRVLADALGIPQADLQVETGALGGGFGARIFAYPEYALLLWLARRIGRPVRWSASRREAFHTDTQGRDHRFDAALALDANGRLLALRVDDRTCLGAYLSQYAPYAQSGCGAPVQAGGYRLRALHVRTRGYFTNMAPVDAFRGTGRPEATYVLERLIDQAAFETGRCPAALRALNLRGPTAEPVTLVTGQEIDGGQFAANQALCLERTDHAGFAARRAASRDRGRLRGFGLANYLEANGSLGVARLTTGGAPQEAAAISFDGRGGATVRVGTQSSGQDHATPLARLAGARLGLDPAAVAVVEGDSDALPLGGGTGGSRSTLAGLHALEALLATVERKAKDVCARRWGVTLGTIDMDGGWLRSRAGDRMIAFAELSRVAPEDLAAAATCRFGEGSFANGCHACEVDVDPDTGAITVLAYTAVDDFGTVLDAGNVRGQVQGGMVQGLGTALMERCGHEAATGRPWCASYDDYPVPGFIEAPAVDWADNGLPSRWTPFGIKACGESAISAAPPAIINAVVDALRGFVGAETLQMPATPDAVLRIVADNPLPLTAADRGTTDFVAPKRKTGSPWKPSA